MRKAICYVLGLLVCLFLLQYASKGTSIVTLNGKENVITADKTTDNNRDSISLFVTSSDEEYLKFLTKNDDKYEIIDIHTQLIGPPPYDEYYLITYRKPIQKK